MSQQLTKEQRDTLDMDMAIFKKMSSIDETLKIQSQSISDLNEKIDLLQKTVDDLTNQNEINAITKKHQSYFKTIHDVIHPDFS